MYAMHSPCSLGSGSCITAKQTLRRPETDLFSIIQVADGSHFRYDEALWAQSSKIPPQGHVMNDCVLETGNNFMQEYKAWRLRLE